MIMMKDARIGGNCTRVTSAPVYVCVRVFKKVPWIMSGHLMLHPSYYFFYMLLFLFLSLSLSLSLSLLLLE